MGRERLLTSVAPCGQPSAMSDKQRQRADKTTTRKRDPGWRSRGCGVSCGGRGTQALRRCHLTTGRYCGRSHPPAYGAGWWRWILLLQGALGRRDAEGQYNFASLPISVGGSDSGVLGAEAAGLAAQKMCCSLNRDSVLRLYWFGVSKHDSRRTPKKVCQQR